MTRSGQGGIVVHPLSWRFRFGVHVQHKDLRHEYLARSTVRALTRAAIKQYTLGPARQISLRDPYNTMLTLGFCAT